MLPLFVLQWESRRRRRCWPSPICLASCERTAAYLGATIDICMRRLPGPTNLSRDEMRSAAYPDTMPEIDVCAGAT